MPNFLTDKLGPLPGWAWGLVGVGALLYWRHRQAAAAGASPAAAGMAAAPSGYTGSYGADSGGGAGFNLPGSMAAAPAPSIPYTYSGGAGTPFSYSGPTDISSGALADLLGGPTAAIAGTPGASPMGASNGVSSPPPANPLAGLTYLPSYSAFEQAKAAGKTIEYVPAGGGAPVTFVKGGQTLAKAPAGSRWYAG